MNIGFAKTQNPYSNPVYHVIISHEVTISNKSTPLSFQDDSNNTQITRQDDYQTVIKMKSSLCGKVRGLEEITPFQIKKDNMKSEQASLCKHCMKFLERMVSLYNETLAEMM